MFPPRKPALWARESASLGTWWTVALCPVWLRGHPSSAAGRQVTDGAAAHRSRVALLLEGLSRVRHQRARGCCMGTAPLIPAGGAPIRVAPETSSAPHRAEPMRNKVSPQPVGAITGAVASGFLHLQSPLPKLSACQ